MAPFFFCLALYIGGIIAFLLLRPLQARAVASGVNPLRAAMDGFAPAALIALIQALVIVLVTDATVPLNLSLIHISEPTRQCCTSRMPSSA